MEQQQEGTTKELETISLNELPPPTQLVEERIGLLQSGGNTRRLLEDEEYDQQNRNRIRSRRTAK